MPQFTYWARDANGQMVIGSLDAPDERAVATSLSQLGYHPVRIQQRGAMEQAMAAMPWRRRRVDRQEVLILMRELAALLRAGIPLASSLEATIQQTRSVGLRQVMSDVTQRVQTGSSFSESLAHHEQVFPELFVSMIRVGETAGILDQVLEQLAQLGTQELETRSHVRSALVYPLVLVSFALLVVNGLLIGVLPRFVAIFESSQVTLPWPTQILLILSWTLRKYWWVIGLGLAGLVWLLKQYHASSNGRWVIDQAILNFPVVGTLYSKIMIARITRMLGSMLKTGVPLLEALAVVEKTVPNVVYQKTIEQTRMAVAEGKTLSEPLASSRLFPNLVLQLVSVGERSGQLDAMLSETASFYEPEIQLSIRNLTTLLEPMLLLTMGLAVGFIALSVLLPIFQLIHVFRR